MLKALLGLVCDDALVVFSRCKWAGIESECTARPCAASNSLSAVRSASLSDYPQKVALDCNIIRCFVTLQSSRLLTHVDCIRSTALFLTRVCLRWFRFSSGRTSSPSHPPFHQMAVVWAGEEGGDEPRYHALCLLGAAPLADSHRATAQPFPSHPIHMYTHPSRAF